MTDRDPRQFQTQWLVTRALREAGQRTRDQVVDELLDMLSEAILATQERLLAVEKKVDLLDDRMADLILANDSEHE